MKPFAVGQFVRISDADKLTPHLHDPHGVLVPEHLAQAGQITQIRTVYVTVHDGTPYYFYALKNSPILWPHAAFDLCARKLFVSEAKPLQRGPRKKNSLEAAVETIPFPNLYVGGLPYEMPDTAVLRLFQGFGYVEAVQIIMDSMTSRSRGFGFVKFRDTRHANDAIATVHGHEVTVNGDLASFYQTEEYLAWIRRSWDIAITGLREYSNNDIGRLEVMAILEDTSRRLAECIADYPFALSCIEWRDFERMLATVFEGLGFGVTCGRGSKDGGIDLRLTTVSNKYVVQAKHWVSGKKVGGGALRTTVTIAEMGGQDGAVVLSTSGFARNAMTAMTTMQRARLRIGERQEIHLLCRTYVSVDHGLLQPVDPNAILKTHTRSVE